MYTIFHILFFYFSQCVFEKNKNLCIVIYNNKKNLKNTKDASDEHHLNLKCNEMYTFLCALGLLGNDVF